MFLIRLLSSSFLVASLFCHSAAASLNEGLVAYYPLDGNAQDESGNGKHGAAGGGVTFVPGVSNQAAHFDGVDDLIRLPDGLIEQETFTVSIYIRPEDGNDDNKPYRIFDAWSGGEIVALAYGESMEVTSGVGYSGIGDYLVGSFHPTYSNTSVFTEQHLFSKTPPSFKASWHHIVLSFDGTIARFFVDGILVNKFVFDASVRNYYAYPDRAQYLASINYTLGASLRHLTFYSGLIDDVRIYDRAISQEEVLALSKVVVDRCGAYCDPLFSFNLPELLDPPEIVPAPEEPVPLPDERKRNVAVLVHGWNSNPSVWAEDTKSLIDDYLASKGELCEANLTADPCWEVLTWNWEAGAKELLPDWAYNNTKPSADILTAWLTKKYGGSWNHLHLIGHSAGSKLIDTVAKKLLQQKKNEEPSPRSLHLTFLDPFTPLDTDRMNYGRIDNSILPNFSESYLTDNIPTPGVLDALLAYAAIKDPTGFVDSFEDADILAAYRAWEETKGPLANSFNFYIDGLASEWLLDPLQDRFLSAVMWSLDNHAWPYQFYQCSVPPQRTHFFGEGVQTSQDCPSNDGRYGFGFVNGLEYAPYNTIMTLQENWKPGHSCVAYSTTTCSDPLGVYIKRTVVNSANATVDFAKTTVSTTGRVIVNTALAEYELLIDLSRLMTDYRNEVLLPYIHQLLMDSGSPAWVRLPITIDSPANYLSFKFKFKREAPGIIRAFIHGKEIWHADQRFYTNGKLWEAEMGIGELQPGRYELAFRLDPLTDAQASVELSDIELGRMTLEEGTNEPPTASAGLARVVRQGSMVALDGGASSDPDNGPSPLTYSWVQMGGPETTLNQPDTVTPVFTPSSQGVYRFALTVSDGAARSAPAGTTINVPRLGDIDLDGDVDNNDLNRILAARNKPATSPNDLRDLDGNMLIDALDARRLTTLCTRPRCATQ